MFIGRHAVWQGSVVQEGLHGRYIVDTPEGGLYRGLYRGVLYGVVKGDPRSLDYSSCKVLPVWHVVHGLHYRQFAPDDKPKFMNNNEPKFCSQTTSCPTF